MKNQSPLSDLMMSNQLLCLNAFWGEPASFGFEWHFTTTHPLILHALVSTSEEQRIIPDLRRGIDGDSQISHNVIPTYYLPYVKRIHSY